MKSITYHICEICHSRNTDIQVARECEARGRGPEYPRGMIYGNHSRGSFYKDITFAVASNHIDGHSNDGASWACRDNCAGDSNAIHDVCGGHTLSPDKHDRPDKTHPTFARMVRLLEIFGFKVSEITVWDGTKPVPLKEFVS